MNTGSQSESPAATRVLGTRELRRVGRSPATPFAVTTEGGQPVTIQRVLRTIPGKRLVAEGVFDGKQVLVKLFFSHRARLHRYRELRGIRALQAAGIPTPEILDSSRLADGKSYLLLNRFFASAETLDLDQDSQHSGRVDRFEQAFALAGQLHAAGLRHTDLHPGNFLKHGDRLFLLDGDAVDLLQPGKPLRGRTALRNLASLAAVLPEASERLLEAYRQANPSYAPDLRQLEEAAGEIRTAGRVRDMKKAVRNSTRFAALKSRRRFQVVRRSWRKALAELIDKPDDAMMEGRILKDGGSSTVVAIDSPAGPAVIKRYNIKGRWHGFRRLWRPSRAWVSWRAARLLEIVGLHTPTQLAMIEERIGPWRQRAWLITSYCPGTPLSEHLSPERMPAPEETEALRQLLHILWRERVSHGDLKASNLLWHQGKLFVIDLDSMQRHRSRLIHRRAWRRDRQRLLDNWPQDSTLYRWLDENLPRGHSEATVTHSVAGVGPLHCLLYSSIEAAPLLPPGIC